MTIPETLQRRLLWAGIGTAAITIVLIIWVDAPLALFFHAYQDTDWVKFFVLITNLANGVIWYTIAVLALGLAYVRHKVRLPNPAILQQQVHAWLFMIVTMASSGIFSNALKLAVGRERPRFLFRDGASEFHPFDLNLTDCSFPSGHTQSIWTAMLSLAFIFPPLRPFFFLIAVMVSASRIIIGAHYAGDVAAATYIAVVSAVLWRLWFERNGVSVTLARGRSA
jgi:membrane-associated phospholipid phosphatase